MRHRLVLVSACLVARCSRVGCGWLPLTDTPPPLVFVFFFFFCLARWWPEKSRNDRKSAGALFWHLNWPDHPEVYIKGRVRPEKKIRPKWQSAAILDRIFSTSVRASE
jgi:hypothetical protein